MGIFGCRPGDPNRVSIVSTYSRAFSKIMVRLLSCHVRDPRLFQIPSFMGAGLLKWYQMPPSQAWDLMLLAGRHPPRAGNSHSCYMAGVPSNSILRGCLPYMRQCACPLSDPMSFLNELLVCGRAWRLTPFGFRGWLFVGT